MKSVVVSFIIALALGVMGVALAVYAEADDAPGGVVLGWLLVIGAVVTAARALRRTRYPHPPA